MVEDLAIPQLSDHELESLNGYGFYGMLSLTHLHLSNNRIKTIRNSSFCGMSSLKYRNLNGNTIEYLDEGFVNTLTIFCLETDTPGLCCFVPAGSADHLKNK